MRPTLPANLAAPCPIIPSIAGEKWDDLGKSYITLAGLYGECKVKQAGLVQAWDK